MDEQTHKALIASIEKWERNAEAETPEAYRTRANHCPLCTLYVKSACRGCPVMARTSRPGCVGTPWHEADDAKRDWSTLPQRARLRNEARAAARKDVEFLKSLLPEGVGHD